VIAGLDVYWIARSSRATKTSSAEAQRPKRSPDRRCVLDAAGVPELVEAARNPELRSAADIAIIDFTVIADMADDARGPIPGQAEVFAIGAFGSNQPHHIRLLRFQRFVDVLRCDAEFFG